MPGEGEVGFLGKQSHLYEVVGERGQAQVQKEQVSHSFFHVFCLCRVWRGAGGGLKCDAVCLDLGERLRGCGVGLTSAATVYRLRRSYLTWLYTVIRTVFVYRRGWRGKQSPYHR